MQTHMQGIQVLALSLTGCGILDKPLKVNGLSFPTCKISASSLGFPGGAGVKNLPADAGDVGSISGLGRFPGEGNGNLFRYSCLENFIDRGAWWATVHQVPKELGTTERSVHAQLFYPP